MITAANLGELQTKLENELKFVCNELNNCPQGRLLKTVERGKVVFYQDMKSGGTRTRRRINRNLEIIKGLARKKYLETKARLLDDNIDVIRKASAEFYDTSPENILQSLPRSYRQLPQDLFFQAAEDPLFSWAQEPYKQSSYMPDRKIHLTSQGLRVRSKSEVLICEKLYEFRVPFRYEQTLAIGKYELSPDFTVLSKSGKIFYWEHCGMPGNQEYMKRHKWKMDMYETIDIVPWKNLIVTYDNENGTIDLAIIDSEIRNKLL